MQMQHKDILFCPARTSVGALVICVILLQLVGASIESHMTFKSHICLLFQMQFSTYVGQTAMLSDSVTVTAIQPQC